MISFPLAMPATPGFVDCSFEPMTKIGLTVGEFDDSQQVQDWGVDTGWKLTATLPPMDRATAEPWLAWYLSQRGPGGCFYVGDPNGKTARGTFAGTPRVNGANQTGKVLLVDGFTPDAAVAKAGDYIQLGAGVSATRIQTAGGASVDKMLLNIVSPSVNTQKYRTAVRVKNIGVKSLVIGDNIGNSQVVAGGTEATFLPMYGIGNGVDNLQMKFSALAVGDALDFVAWDPRASRYGIAENLIAATNRKFAGWTAVSGATVTLTQGSTAWGIAQRLYKLLADVTADSAGGGELDIFPTLRDAPFDNELVVFTNPKCVMRIVSTKMPWTLSTAKHVGLSFTAIEVL